MLGLIKTNYERELEEKPLVEVSLNRVFLGSPGTGKTTVAKLYGRILADIGLLSNGEGIVASKIRLRALVKFKFFSGDQESLGFHW